MKLNGAVVEIMQNFVAFKLDFKKMFLVMKLGEDLKTWTGSTKSDKILGFIFLIRNVWNDQVSKILELWNSVGW